MIQNATGLILRTRPLTETSLVVLWLTPDFGRIATVAKGARRLKSPFLGKLDIFYEADFSFSRSRHSDLHALREVVLHEMHGAIRDDILKLSQAAYATALIEQATETETPLPAIFELLRGFLDCLCSQKPSVQLVFAFELKLLRELGLDPDLQKTNLTDGAKQIVRALLKGGWPACLRLKLTRAQTAELRQFLHGFLIFHLGKPAQRTRGGACGRNLKSLSERHIMGYICARSEHQMKRSIFRFSTVRMKLVGSVLLLITPALLVMYIYDLPMSGFIVGFLALTAAWMGGEYFVRRQAHALSETARKIADGNLAARTGLPASDDELGQLAKMFDRMAAALEQRIKEREKLAAFAQMNPNAAMEFAGDGTMVYFNDAAQQLALSIEKNHPREVLPENADEIIRDCLATGKSRLRLETKICGRTFSWSFHPMLASHIVHGYAEDITQRLSLEEQLRQAQKMESIGQLAAGVAHDFNNMLTIIQGHTSALLAKPSLPSEVVDPVQAVYFAAERAAGLTRQLLMFSRKNVMQRTQLDLREVVGNLTKMVQRLIGETITLQFQPPEELPFVLRATPA